MRKGLPLRVCRYIDWFITTPLMILNIGLLAGEEQWMIAAIMGADSKSLAAPLSVKLLSDVHLNYLTNVTCLKMKIESVLCKQTLIPSLNVLGTFA